MAIVAATITLLTSGGMVVGTVRAVDTRGMRFELMGEVETERDIEWRMELAGLGETAHGWLIATAEGYASDGVPKYYGRITRINDRDVALFERWRSAVLGGTVNTLFQSRPNEDGMQLGGMSGTTAAERAWSIAQMDERRKARSSRAVEVLGGAKNGWPNAGAPVPTARATDSVFRRDLDLEVTVRIPVPLPPTFRADPRTVPVPIPESHAVSSGRAAARPAFDPTTRPVVSRAYSAEPTTRPQPAPERFSPFPAPPPPAAAMEPPRVECRRISGALFLDVVWTDVRRALLDVQSRVDRASLRVPGRLGGEVGELARLSLVRPGVAPLRVTAKVERLSDRESVLLLPLDELRRWVES